jgi:hypothetical protein
VFRKIIHLLFLALSATATTNIPSNLIIFGSAYASGDPTTASTLYTLAPGSGTGTAIGNIGFTGVGSMDFSANGTLYGVGWDGNADGGDGDSFLITINPATGQGTKIGYLNIGCTVEDIAVQKGTGTLFAYDGCGDGLFSINTSTGVATFIGSPNECDGGNGLAFSGNTLYLANTGSPNDCAEAPVAGGPSAEASGTPQFGTLQILSTSNGSATIQSDLSFPGSIGNNPRINGMKFDPNGNLWSAVHTNSGNYLGVTNLNGNVSIAGPTVSGLNAVAVIINSVPTAPALSDWALLATAIALAFCAKFLLRRARA